MQKARVFYILFFTLSIFAVQLGCAKKIETAKSSASIEGNKTADVPVKQDKVIEISGERGDKEAEKKIIGEESVVKGTTSIEASRGNKDSEPGETAKGGDLPSMEPIEKKPAVIEGGEAPESDHRETPPLSEKDGGEIQSLDKETHVAKKEPGASPEAGGRPESRQDLVLSEALKKDEESLVTPDKEILAAKEESGPALEDIRKGREDSVLNDIFFDFNSWIIKGNFIGILEQDAKYLVSKPGLKVQIEGHADERGTNEYNLALGERRAKSTMNFLIDMGVGPERISIITYGEERPFCKGHGESCWSINRRGHFTVIDE